MSTTCFRVVNGSFQVVYAKETLGMKTNMETFHEGLDVTSDELH